MAESRASGLVEHAVRDPLAWYEKADFGRASQVGINLFAVDTQLRHLRDIAIISVHSFIYSFT